MKRILLVEDDKSLARGIAFTLEKEKWQVICTESTTEGLQLAISESFDVIILDIMLPDGDGFDLCKRIRAQRNTPIIILTACDEEVNIIQGLDTGADDYITKPFRVKELISRINAVLRRYVVNSGTNETKIIIKSRDIILYLLERKLVKNGRVLTMTPTELELTAVLMQNPNQVLNRNQILDKLWDIDGEFTN